eukprot:GILJ01006577.1.p1 GENE.GILJ01006577.1~~GILJ01006577.1.p1  ORF type:complete len:1422 (-),score=259.03 GILJ01006577.1:145-4323(-)
MEPTDTSKRGRRPSHGQNRRKSADSNVEEQVKQQVAGIVEQVKALSGTPIPDTKVQRAPRARKPKSHQPDPGSIPTPVDFFGESQYSTGTYASSTGVMMPIIPQTRRGSHDLINEQVDTVTRDNSGTMQARPQSKRGRNRGKGRENIRDGGVSGSDTQPPVLPLSSLAADGATDGSNQAHTDRGGQGRGGARGRGRGRGGAGQAVPSHQSFAEAQQMIYAVGPPIAPSPLNVHTVGVNFAARSRGGGRGVGRPGSAPLHAPLNAPVTAPSMASKTSWRQSLSSTMDNTFDDDARAQNSMMTPPPTSQRKPRERRSSDNSKQQRRNNEGNRKEQAASRVSNPNGNGNDSVETDSLSTPIKPESMRNNNSQSARKTSEKKQTPRKGRQIFEPYLSPMAVSKGVKSGTLYMGALRINANNPRHAYVTVEGLARDVFIDGMADRNRAFDGDTVVLELYGKEKWKHLQDKYVVADLLEDDPLDLEEHPLDTSPLQEFPTLELLAKTGERPSESSPPSLPPSAATASSAPSASPLTASQQFQQQTTPGDHLKGHVAGDSNQHEEKEEEDEEEEEEDENGFEVLKDPAADVLFSSESETEQQKGHHPTRLPSGATPVSPVPGFTSPPLSSRPAESSPPDLAVDSTIEDLSSGIQHISLQPKRLHETPNGTASKRKASTEECLQPSGRIVAIVKSTRTEKEHIAVLQPANETGAVRKDDRFVYATPTDKRAPRFLIPIGSLTDEMLSTVKPNSMALYPVRFDRWGCEFRYPIGKVGPKIGMAGDIEAETQALLREFAVDDSEFSEPVLKSLEKFNRDVDPVTHEWKIPESELNRRRDLRSTRIFTIDPLTARDLDDALSITPLFDDSIHYEPTPDDVFEIGVHIADVSYFLEENSVLDKVARERATSVYLVQKVIPMLPRLLCENLCSLNPAVDRLAYTVFFKIRRDGQLTADKPWFGRTVIRSCVKGNYELVQRMVDGEIREPEQMPELYRPTGGHSSAAVIRDCLLMDEIAKNRRRWRFDNGALSLGKMKIVFDLDDKGYPTGFRQYMGKEANHLVEEYMLLANQLVAEQLVMKCEQAALLRRHPSPLQRKFEEFCNFCKLHHVDISGASAGELYQSLRRAKTAHNEDVAKAVEYLATRPMQPAAYFVAGKLADQRAWRHYALNMPMYTHFTSPIRRYADVMVHRLLSLSLVDLDHAPTHFPIDELSRVCDNCNEKKLNSRKAQDKSGKVFLCLLLKSTPQIMEAIVMEMGQKSMYVLIPTLGVEKHIHFEDLDTAKFEVDATNGVASFWLWKDSPLAPKLLEDNNEDEEPISAHKKKNHSDSNKTPKKKLLSQITPEDIEVQTVKVFHRVSVHISTINRIPIDFCIKLLSPRQRSRLNMSHATVDAAVTHPSLPVPQ